MMRLILTRHGKTDWNLMGKTQGTTDTLLNAEGKKQAFWLAQRLKKEGIRFIYASPLQRARETALIIQQELGNECPLTPDERLCEVHYGKWEGLRYHEITQFYPQEGQQWEEDPTRCQIPGGESMESLIRRYCSFYDEIKRKHANDTVLVVGHALTCKIIIAYAIGLPFSRFHSIAATNTSVSILEVSENLAKLVLLNEIPLPSGERENDV